MKVHKLVSCS